METKDDTQNLKKEMTLDPKIELRSHVQAMRKKGSSTSNPVHELPVAVSGGFHRGLRPRFIDHNVDHPGWYPLDAQVFEYPVLWSEEQREAEESIADKMSHR